MIPPKDPLSNSPSAPRRRRWPLIVAAVVVILALDVGIILWLLPSKKTLAPATAIHSAPGTPEPVPLSEFADQATRRWGTVPRGTQVCDGVTFICDGAIRTAGLRAGANFPGAVLDVPVRGRGARIHLLQSSENSLSAVPGEPYGRMILHYANGETRRFDLLFRAHGRDWMHNPRDPDKPLLDENTTVGWSELRPRDGFLIRFHHVTFTNPLPDMEITSADFISPLHSANLLLFGLTVDNDSRPLAPPWEPAGATAIPPTDKLTVTLQDAGGQRLPIATVAWTAIAQRGQVDFPPIRPNAQGRMTLEFQHSAIRQIRYTVTATGGKTISGELQPDDTGNFAPNAIIRLSP